MKVRVVWSGRKAPFLCPISSEPRTAVLLPGFRPSGNVRVFPQGWCPEAAAFRPAAIAGSRQQLTGLLGTPLPSLTHALIVVLKQGNRPVSEAERERFWRAFGVPLFEQIVNSSGHVLASECDAHNGLHIHAKGVPAADLMLEDHELDESICGCGKKTPRIRPLGHPELERIAAYAR